MEGNKLRKIEADGRTYEELEDGSLRITLNRRDSIEIAMQVYDEYFSSESDKTETFGDYLSKELEKETNGSAR